MESLNTRIYQFSLNSRAWFINALISQGRADLALIQLKLLKRELAAFKAISETNVIELKKAA